MKRILILGGGFAGVEMYTQLHKRLHPVSQHNVSIELINRTNFFTFSPMLHEAATGSVAREHVVQPLREMLSCCGKDFHQASVLGVDPARKIVRTDRGEHSYDILIVALGVEQGFFGTPGAEQHALALKWLPGAVAIRNRIINSLERASEMHDKNNQEALNRFLHFVVVGGGATGTELAGQLSDLLTNELSRFYGDVPQSMCQITLVHDGSRLLEQLSPKASMSAARRLGELGVHLRLNETVTEVTPEGVQLQSGAFIPSNSVLWTAGTESTLTNMLPAEMLNQRGLVKVQATFQTIHHPDIFALGDCASVQEKKYAFPPLAQAAVQASRIASRNVEAYLAGNKLRVRRYHHKGDIIPIGDWFAIFDLKGRTVSGKLAWMARRTVFLKTMYGWANRLQVAFDWFIGIFLPRDTSEF